MVTETSVQTRFATVSLADIDLVEVGLPLVGGGAPLAIACTLLGLRFGDVLTIGELASLISFGWLGLCAALLIARIKLHSYSINGLAITLPVWRALAMRRAIDTALAHKSRNNLTNARRTA
jgi:hypothetical protein